MFPPNVKNHNMKLRKSEIFKVIHAKRSKYQKSAIIHMQNKLNEDQEYINTYK